MRNLIIFLLFFNISSAQYNLFARQNFSYKSVSNGANTEIGGVASTISTPALLAAKLGILESRITNFSIVGSDIKCKITGSYAMPANAFAENNNITYFNDETGLVISLIAYDCFKNANNLKYTYFPNCADVQGTTHYSLNASTQLDYIYIPRSTLLGSSVGDNGIFQFITRPSWLLYVHPSLATNNAGNPDGDLVYASGRNAQIRYVTNFTAPDAISTLAAGNVYNTAIQINFTAPSSTNTIEWYELYVNGVYSKKIISGQYAMNLLTSTSYSFTVYSVDIFRNKSLVSNVLTQSTNTSPFMARDRMISYYKLDETSGSTANDSFSTQHLTNTSVSINQSGKIGTSYLSTLVGQKLETTSATSITGKFTLNAWIYRTANASNYGGILQQGDYGTSNGFGMWLLSDNSLSWRINTTYRNSPGTLVIPLNTWTMITMVYNQVNVKIYIDGVLQVTTAHTVNPVTVAKRTLFYNTNNNAEFFGKIDEASFYNGELTQSEINELYNSGIGTTL